MRLKLEVEITDEQYNHLTRDGMVLESDAVKRLIVRNFNKHSKPGSLYIEDFLFGNFDFNLDSKVSANKVYKLYLSECSRLNCTPIGRNQFYKELNSTPELHSKVSDGNRLWIYGLEE